MNSAVADRHELRRSHRGLALLAVIALVQALGGSHSHSLGLGSEAAHNLGDNLSGITTFFGSWLALRLAAPAAARLRTWIGRFNALVLLAAAVVIFAGAVSRLNDHTSVRGDLMMFYATCSIALNALLWHNWSRCAGEVCISAKLHAAKDFWMSIGLFVGGALKHFADISAIDTGFALVAAPVVGLSAILFLINPRRNFFHEWWHKLTKAKHHH